jgi:exodeoxyribonuclease V alpha subunit
MGELRENAELQEVIERLLEELEEFPWMIGFVLPMIKRLERIFGTLSSIEKLVFLLLHRVTLEGSTCLPLSAWSGQRIEALFPETEIRHKLPPKELCLKLLDASSIISKGESDEKPILIDKNESFYFKRFYKKENEVAQWFAKRLHHNTKEEHEVDEELFRRFFPEKELDEKAIAAAKKLLKTPFGVLIGPPGSGKTSLVTRLLSYWNAYLGHQRFRGDKSKAYEHEGTVEGAESSRFLLLAPTGKAAFRLKESLEAKAHLQGIAFETSTIHRKLIELRSDQEGKLPVFSNPLVLIDEFSMVDLETFHTLIKHIPDSTRLMLLGDPHQLPSVGPGNLLNDLCSFENAHSEIKGENNIKMNVCRLEKSYRYAEDSALGQISANIRKGDISNVIKEVQQASREELISFSFDQSEPFLDYVVQKYRETLNKKDPLDRLNSLNTFRVLCIQKEGPYGVRNLNAQIQVSLFKQGVLPYADKLCEGVPLLIERNSYSKQLFNGDVGLIQKVPFSEELEAQYSEDSHPKGLHVEFLAEGNEVVSKAYSSLPKHQAAFAMTVHKSQGSEYDECALVLPAEAPAWVGRSLIYTALTRAKKKLIIFGSLSTLETCLNQNKVRKSGLYPMIIDAYEKPIKASPSQLSLL